MLSQPSPQRTPRLIFVSGMGLVALLAGCSDDSALPMGFLRFLVWTLFVCMLLSRRQKKDGDGPPT